MSTIDRAALIEQASIATWTGMEFGPMTSLDRDGMHHELSFALPVIAKALLAPLRELHAPAIVYALADECGCGNEEDHVILETVTGDDVCWDTPTDERFCPECTGDATEELVAHPCPTVRLLDAIEAEVQQ